MNHEDYAMGFLLLVGMVFSSLGLFFVFLWAWAFVWEKMLSVFNIKRAIFEYYFNKRSFQRYLKETGGRKE